MNRIFSLVLACALAFSLTACGSKDAGSASSVSGSGQSGVSSSAPDASQPGSSAPDASQPDSSVGVQPAPLPESDAATLTLNKSDFTLKSAGASYKLKYTVDASTDGMVTFTSSDESVATVDSDGKVTAVAPGTAVITAVYEDLTAECIVRCSWEEQSESSNSSAGSSAPSSTKVDLAAFYEEIMASAGDSAPFMMELDAEMAESIYPGIGATATKQQVLFMPAMSAVACEIAMVECANASDAETVKAIFQSRIDTQVNGGAWYPETIEGWKNNSKIVVNGSYVAMFVIPEGMMDAASAFNALF